MSSGTEGARLGALQMMCYSRHLCIPITQCCQPRSWTCHVVNYLVAARISIELSQYISTGHCRKFAKCFFGRFSKIANTNYYLHNPWCRVLLEQLTGLQLVKKFPVFHGTRRFVTAPTSVRQLSLPWASPIQSIYSHPTSWRSVLILSTHLRLGLPSGLFPSG